MKGLVAIAITLMSSWLMPAAAAAPASLDWLSGHWCLDENGAVTDELWLPASDLMVGVSRTVTAGKTTAFEFLRIASVAGVWTYLAQPGGQPAIAFTYADGGHDWIRFENRQHDFPQRIEYRRSGDNLQAAISGPDADGKEQVIAYRYAKCETRAAAE